MMKVWTAWELCKFQASENKKLREEKEKEKGPLVCVANVAMMFITHNIILYDMGELTAV